MDGVMLRNGAFYSLAVRHANGSIRVKRFPWRSLAGPFLQGIPFLRGFPILLETVLNGITALNRAATLSGREDNLSTPRMALSIFLAILVAAGLFIIAPHILSLGMQALGLGGDVSGVTFHLWDGLFKVLIFMVYVVLISFVPDIRRVFAYHGAEHKAVHAWENCVFVDRMGAAAMDRLHPRCGTTFVLFVVVISIFLQTLLVPLFLEHFTPATFMGRQLGSVLFKLGLIIPVSAIAYELICLAANVTPRFPAMLLQTPGLFLQYMTTREPAPAELDVALVALASAVDPDEAVSIATVPHDRLPSEMAARN